MSMRYLALAGAVAVVAAVIFTFMRAGAQETRQMLSARDAHTKASAGEIVLVDIRTPEEWKETGVPASAHAITLNQDPKALVAKLKDALGGDTSKPLALICRTGNRSSRLQAELAKAGFTNVLDVGEGMAGSSHGAGWLKAGLPRRTGADVSLPPPPVSRAGAR